MEEADCWRLHLDHAAHGLALFLDARFDEARDVLEMDTAEWREVVGKHMIVERCRSVIARPFHRDEDMMRHLAYETLQDLGRPWTGAPDGSGRHPEYLEEWRPRP